LIDRANAQFARAQKVYAELFQKNEEDLAREIKREKIRLASQAQDPHI